MIRRHFGGKQSRRLQPSWLKRQRQKLLQARAKRHTSPRVRVFKVGDWVNDCDGFNHRIASRINEDQYAFEDGKWSCGCPYGPVPAWSVKKIEMYFRRHYAPANVSHWKEQGWWDEVSEERLQRLLAGQPICDEFGRKL